MRKTTHYQILTYIIPATLYALYKLGGFSILLTAVFILFALKLICFNFATVDLLVSRKDQLEYNYEQAKNLKSILKLSAEEKAERRR